MRTGDLRYEYNGCNKQYFFTKFVIVKSEVCEIEESSNARTISIWPQSPHG